jgi:branched-chain amino acid transport system substrate-binding protein
VWERISAPALPLCAIIAAVGLFGSTISAARGDIKIGFQAPLTGPAATDGKSAKIAAEIALDDINAAGGVLGQKLDLISYDDEAKPDQAVFTANKLIGENGVKLAINGSYSASGRAAAPIFQKAGVATIVAYGVHPDITRAGDYIFRLVHLGPPQGRAGAYFVGQRLGLRRVSVISVDSDYGQATVEGFVSVADQFGIKILNKYSYAPQERQFDSIVASVKHDDPAAIYATGYFFTAAPLVSQLRAAGINAPIIGSQAFDSEKFIEIAGPAANGVYIIDSFDRDRDDPVLRHFLMEFQKRAGYAAEGVAASVDSSFKLLANAIARAGSAEPAKVRDALAATRDFPMLEGPLIGFNRAREIKMPVGVNVVKDGKFKFYALIDDLKLLGTPEE